MQQFKLHRARKLARRNKHVTKAQTVSQTSSKSFYLKMQKFLGVVVTVPTFLNQAQHLLPADVVQSTIDTVYTWVTHFLN